MQLRHNISFTVTIVILTGIISFLLLIPDFQPQFVKDSGIFNWTDDEFLNKRIGKIFAFGLLPLVVSCFLIKGNVLSALGLTENLFKGFTWALVISLPAIIGFWIFYKPGAGVSIPKILFAAAIAGVTEEIFFRGFLFGMLFRFCKWGFLPAIFITAFLFGLAHWSQGKTLADSLGVFGITFAASLWFCWLYAEWKYNLWLPVFIHFLINFFWDFFAISDNAVGPIPANLLRVSIIILSIIVIKKMRVKEKRSRIVSLNRLLRNE